jgi:hypothetical protein
MLRDYIIDMQISITSTNYNHLENKIAMKFPFIIGTIRQITW